MAIGDSYATLDQLKQYIEPKFLTTVDQGRDALLEAALDSASREIERFCHRQFNKQTEATTRVYSARSARTVHVDDFWDDSDLVMKVGEIGGSFGAAWPVDHYEVFPLNGVVDGVPGYPFTRIKLKRPGTILYSRDRIQVTAKWGWSSVPGPVRYACLQLAARNYKMNDFPVGESSGLKGFGVSKINDDPVLCQKLGRYVRQAEMV